MRHRSRITVDGRPQLSEIQRQRRVIFGERLRREREAAGLSIEDLAQILGITIPAVQRVERGQRSFPAELLTDLGRALGTTGARLTGEHATIVRAA